MRLTLRRLSIALLIACSLPLACEDDPNDLDYLKDAGPGGGAGGAHAAGTGGAGGTHAAGTGGAGGAKAGAGGNEADAG